MERLREKAADEKKVEEPEQETAEARSSIREYVVLSNTGAQTWKEVARVNAGSADTAIRTLGQKLSNDSEYLAVPTRNWNPVLVKVETTTAFRLTPK
jgi:hypothetical protein